MRATLLTIDGPALDVSWPTVEDELARRRGRGDVFWLDIVAPTDADVDTLGALLRLHPLSIEDSKEFDQHSKVVVYDGYALLVAFAMDGTMGAVSEVHGYYGTTYLVTLH